MGLLNNEDRWPFDPHMGHRAQYEKNKEAFKKPRPFLAWGLSKGRPQALERAERTKEYVSTAKGHPACALARRRAAAPAKGQRHFSTLPT
jgi:hypothetical protein